MDFLKKIVLAGHVLVILAIAYLLVTGPVTFGDFCLYLAFLILFVLPSMIRLTR